MDENTVKFEEKLKELVEFAKRKKGTLENQKIMEFFSEVDLDPDQMDHIYEVLENNNIDITRITDDDDDDPDIILSEEDEVEMENIDLSVPDGISIEDPVRMYLKEIGKVPLLTCRGRNRACKKNGRGR